MWHVVCHVAVFSWVGFDAGSQNERNERFIGTPESSTGVRGNGTAGSEVATLSATRLPPHKTFVSLTLGIDPVPSDVKSPRRSGARGYSAMRTTR